jgi:hypothetical protein
MGDSKLPKKEKEGDLISVNWKGFSSDSTY